MGSISVGLPSGDTEEVHSLAQLELESPTEMLIVATWSRGCSCVTSRPLSDPAAPGSLLFSSLTADTLTVGAEGLRSSLTRW